MARTAVVDPISQKVVYVDDADLGAATRQGYSVATPEETRRSELEAEYGGVTGAIGGALAGLGASIMTESGLKLAAKQFGKEQVIEDLKTAQPEAFYGSEVAGVLGLGLLSGGATAAGRTALGRAAAMTVPGAATRAGAAATRLVFGEAAAAAAPTVVGAASRLAVGGAVESATQSAFEETARLALDNKLNGEAFGQIASKSLLSGTFGFGIGAGLGLLGGTAAKGLRRLLGQIDDVASGPVAKEVAERLPAGTIPEWKVRAAEFQAGVRGADKAFAREYLETQAARSMTEDAQEEIARRLSLGVPARQRVSPKTGELVDAPAIKPSLTSEAIEASASKEASTLESRLSKAADPEAEAATALADLTDSIAARDRNIRQDLNDYLVGAELADLATKSRALKSQVLVSKNVDSAQRAAQTAAVENSILEFDDLLRTVKADPDKYGRTYVKSLESLAARTEQKFYEALELPAEQQPVALFDTLDREFKSGLGQITKKAYKAGRSDTQARNVFEALRESYTIPQRTLERVDLWGKAGEVNQIGNALITQKIRKRQAFIQDFFETGRLRRSNPVDPWSDGLPLSDANKINQHAKDAALRPKGDSTNVELTLKEMAQLETDYAKFVKQYGDLEATPDLARALDGQEKLMPRILEEFEELKKLHRVEQFENPSGTGFSRAVASVPDAAGGGVLRAIASGTVLNPRLLAAGLRVGHGAERIVDAAAKSEQKVVESGVNRAMRSIADTSMAIQKRLPVAGAMVQKYREREQRLQQLAAQAPAVRAELERSTEWMQDRAPAARAAAVDTPLKIVDYLQQKAPKSLGASTPFSNPLPPSKQQMQEWLNRVRAIENPATLLDDMAKGKLTPEAVDAVREVYPETFAVIQARMLDKLTDMEVKGKRPAYKERIQLALILGVPTDPTMTPEVMRAVQAQYAGKSPEERQGQAPAKPLGGKGTKSPDFAGAYRSGAEETELTSGANP
jgi:hypothetical protein